MRLEDGRYVACSASEATHLKIHMPGPAGILVLPVIQRGPRAGTPCWTWNGSVEAPTLRPSVLSTIERGGGGQIRCHSWVTDGMVHFLDDCTHSLRGEIVELFNIYGL